jgi:hypothetical protein
LARFRESDAFLFAGGVHPMLFTIQGWLRFLASDMSAYGIPLILCGVALMTFGWRLWKVCVVVSFGVIGAGIGSRFGQADGMANWYAIGGGLLLGALSYRPAHHAIAVLGGLVGAAIIAALLSGAGQNGPLLWLGSSFGFIVGSGMAFLHRSYVVVFVTSILGAALLVSGLTAAVMTSAQLYNSLRHITSSSSIIVPFLIIVPTVMSCFIQASELKRVDAEL